MRGPVATVPGPAPSAGDAGAPIESGIPYWYTIVIDSGMDDHGTRSRAPELPLDGAPGSPVPAGADVAAAGSGLHLAERATAELRRLILSFALRPGERLPERRLERLLAVSRSPIRQALAQLAGEGLVRRDGRGYGVAPVDVGELQELFAYRSVLETAAVRWAAASASEGALVEVEAALIELAAEREPEGRLAATARLHLGLARAGGNRFVVEALGALFPRITRARYLELGSPRTVRLADDEHRQIVQLVREGRGDEAAGTMRAHLERTCRNLVESLGRQSGIRAMVGEPLV